MKVRMTPHCVIMCVLNSLSILLIFSQLEQLHTQRCEKICIKRAAQIVIEYIIVEHTETPTSKNNYEEDDPQKLEDRKLAIHYQEAKLRVKVPKKFIILKLCLESHGSLSVFRYCH